MSSVRERVEQAQLAALYQAETAKRDASAAERDAEARLSKLRAAADAIRTQETELALVQSGLEPDELDIINRRLHESDPAALGNADRWSAEAMKIRAEGGKALEDALYGATREELAKVLTKLASATPEQRQGLDSGVAAAAALEQVRDEE